MKAVIFDDGMLYYIVFSKWTHFEDTIYRNGEGQNKQIENRKRIRATQIKVYHLELRRIFELSYVAYPSSRGKELWSIQHTVRHMNQKKGNEGKLASKGDTSNFDNFESNTRNITDRVSLTTETGNKNLIVLVDEVETTIVGHESRDFLAVLDELHSATLTNSRVRLFGLNTNLLENDTLGVRGTFEWVRLQSRTKMLLLVALLCPTLHTTMVAKFTGGTNTARLAAGTHIALTKLIDFKQPIDKRDVMATRELDLCEP